MTKNNPSEKPIEIFRTGSHTDVHGKKVTVTKTDLENIAQNYDPSFNEAPLVIGHPKKDDKAMGWVEKLSVSDKGILLAHPVQLNSDFKEEVNQGGFKKVSASFYPPNSTYNETSDFALRHVGFFGATMVAVKGLKAVSFSEDEEYVTFDFSAPSWSFDIIARLLSKIRDYMIDKHGTEEADQILSSWDIENLKDHSHDLKIQEANDNTSSDYSEPSQPKSQPSKQEADMPDKDKAAEFAEESAKLKAERKKFDKEKADFAEQQATQCKAENAAFLDEQITAGKIAAGAKDEMLAFMENLDDNETVSFSEKTSKTPLSHFKNMLSAANPIVDFSEKTADENQDDTPSLSDEEIKIHANDFMENEKGKGRSVTLVQAIHHVNKGKSNA